jgi:hypothetical protein
MCDIFDFEKITVYGVPHYNIFSILPSLPATKAIQKQTQENVQKHVITWHTFLQSSQYNVMGGTYSRHGGKRNAYTVQLQNFKVREQFARPGNRCGYYVKKNDRNRAQDCEADRTDPVTGSCGGTGDACRSMLSETGRVWLKRRSLYTPATF